MISSKIACVIPARYSSTRLPGKPLIEIEGLPLVMWAYNSAIKSKVFDEVLIATDDYRIKECAESHGGNAIMTYELHNSGTDRVCEALKNINCSHVINLQGDEPIISTHLLKEMVSKTIELDDKSILTAATQATEEEMSDPSSVKVVLNKNKEALHFSRSSLQFSQNEIFYRGYKHLGIYGFSKESLNRFCSYPMGRLEAIEKIELLRALENSMNIKCIITSEKSIGIDTEKDLKQFRKSIKTMSGDLTCHYQVQ